MAQNFTPGTPATASVPQSVTMRDNFEALLTNHAGPVMPAYAEEGMTWFDSSVGRLKKIRALGSKAYVEFAMGSQINLSVALKGAGQDGSLVTADCRLQDSTLLPVDYKDWTLVTGALHLFFSNTMVPSYFVSNNSPVINDPVIGEALLWTTDGVLLGKNWETIPSGHENLYGTSVLNNVSPFVDTTLRGVEIENAGTEVTIGFDPTGRDHAIIPTSLNWWEWQDGIEIELWENGTRRLDFSYRARVIMISGVVSVIVYNFSNYSANLVGFSSFYHEIRIKKKS